MLVSWHARALIRKCHKGEGATISVHLSSGLCAGDSKKAKAASSIGATAGKGLGGCWYSGMQPTGQDHRISAQPPVPLLPGASFPVGEIASGPSRERTDHLLYTTTATSTIWKTAVTKTPWGKMSVSEIGAALCSHLKKHGIDVTLSGGACVCIYSDNRYVSSDLDFVMGNHPLNEMDPIMAEMGFSRHKSGRYYENPRCPYSVEFPPSPLTVGQELVTKTATIKNVYGTLRLLRVADSVKDRLAAFYHWRDRQSLEQAIMICRRRRVDLSEIRRWSKSEGARTQFAFFQKMLKDAQAKPG
jgi:hypothetical protein